MENKHKLLHEFQRWNALQIPNKPDFIEHLKTHAPWVFAHHPQHACFREHVWKINGLYICKGCLVTSIGFVVGLLFQFASGWLSLFSEEQLGGIFIALLLPTLITGSFGLPRPIKHIARFLLGFLMASALLLLFVTERWAVRLAVVACYLVVQYVFEKKRRKHNQALLHSCSE